TATSARRLHQPQSDRPDRYFSTHQSTRPVVRHQAIPRIAVMISRYGESALSKRMQMTSRTFSTGLALLRVPVMPRSLRSRSARAFAEGERGAAIGGLLSGAVAS